VIPWTTTELRWRSTLLGAMIPGEQLAGLPGLAAIEQQPFWALFEQAAPPLVRLGLRAAVWVLTCWAPLLLLGRLRLFGSLAPADADELLLRAARSRSYLLRQLVTLLKVLACFAYFHDPEVRQRVEGFGGEGR